MTETITEYRVFQYKEGSLQHLPMLARQFLLATPNLGRYVVSRAMKSPDPELLSPGPCRAKSGSDLFWYTDIV